LVSRFADLERFDNYSKIVKSEMAKNKKEVASATSSPQKNSIFINSQNKYF
jgi:hypothetical protein